MQKKRYAVLPDYGRPPDSAVILSDITDHYPVLTHVTLEKAVNNYKSRLTKRKFTQENITTLNECLNHADWSSVYETEDVNLSYCNFFEYPKSSNRKSYT